MKWWYDGTTPRINECQVVTDACQSSRQRGDEGVAICMIQPVRAVACRIQLLYTSQMTEHYQKSLPPDDPLPATFEQEAPPPWKVWFKSLTRQDWTLGLSPSPVPPPTHKRPLSTSQYQQLVADWCVFADRHRVLVTPEKWQQLLALVPTPWMPSPDTIPALLENDAPPSRLALASALIEWQSSKTVKAHPSSWSWLPQSPVYLPLPTNDRWADRVINYALLTDLRLGPGNQKQTSLSPQQQALWLHLVTQIDDCLESQGFQAQENRWRVNLRQVMACLRYLSPQRNPKINDLWDRYGLETFPDIPIFREKPVDPWLSKVCGWYGIIECGMVLGFALNSPRKVFTKDLSSLVSFSLAKRSHSDPQMNALLDQALLDFKHRAHLVFSSHDEVFINSVVTSLTLARAFADNRSPPVSASSRRRRL